MKTKILLTIIIATISFSLIAQTTYTTIPNTASLGDINLAILNCPEDQIIEFEGGDYEFDFIINVNRKITLKNVEGAVCTFDGKGTHPCFELTNDATIDGFTIENGLGTGIIGGGVNIPSTHNGTIRNCIIQGNKAKDGGGVAIYSSGLVENCTIKNNTAQYGGGIRILSANSSAIIRNCLITGNLTTISTGGGIHINGGANAQIINCTIVNNKSTGTNSGGVTSNPASAFINTIIYYNTSGTSNDENYSGSSSSTFIKCCSTNTENTEIELKVPPLFVNEPPYADPTGNSLYTGDYDFHLSSTSPLINEGAYADWMDDAFDLDGITARIINDIVDIGCYEYYTAPPADEDHDGVIDSEDLCLGTIEGEDVDENGCSASQKDTDEDGVMDSEDSCPDTPSGVTVDIHGCPIINNDSDGDGVADVDDDFPEDPNLAFINKFPASGWGSLGFEDLWPGKGDYDFNDLVVDYKFTIYSNKDYVVYITAKFKFKASGAYLQNGFGFNLPTALKSLRADLTVTGFDIQESYIDLKSNGMERGQDCPTIIVCDNVFNVLEHPGSGTGVNTEEWAPFVPFETVTLTMTPTPDTYTLGDFGLNAEEWNPFIIIDMEREREVHLKDRVPTSLADPTILGTVEDDSNPGIGRYYVTKNNLPWAISVPNFDWPREKIEINWAYTYFIEWAESSGTLRTNWYQDRPGFRTESNIYQIPSP